MKKSNKLTLDMFLFHDNFITQEVRMSFIILYNEMVELRDKMAKDFQKHGEYPGQESLDRVEQNIATLSRRITVFYNFMIIIKYKGNECGKNTQNEFFESPLYTFSWVLNNARNKASTKELLNENSKYDKIYDIENFHLYEPVESIYYFLAGYLGYFEKYINFKKEADPDVKLLYEGMGRATLNHPKSVPANLTSVK